MADNQGNSPTAGAWYKTDGSTTSGFSGYIGKLSQVTIVGVWSDAVGFSAAQTRFNDAKNGITIIMSLMTESSSDTHAQISIPQALVAPAHQLMQPFGLSCRTEQLIALICK